VITSTLDCIIERRLLVNYRIEPDHVTAFLPRPFRPQLVRGYAVGGVCFIRMSRLRPAHIPRAMGMTSENVAHRFAVQWDDAQGTHAGVYVPRRETSSRVAAIAGRHVFPGAYHLARFDVTESGHSIRIGVRSHDGNVSLLAEAVPSMEFNSELFPAVDDATAFFRRGALGYSPSAAARDCLDSVRMDAANWAATPMTIARMRSSLFDDPAAFPAGACILDSALLMTNVAARWTAERQPTGRDRQAA
jgi:hypothetical protein